VNNSTGFKSDINRQSAVTNAEERQAQLEANPEEALRSIVEHYSTRIKPERLSYVLSFCNFWELPEDIQNGVIEILNYYDTQAGREPTTTILNTDDINLNWLRYENLTTSYQLHCKESEGHFKSLLSTTQDTGFRHAALAIEDLNDLFVVKLTGVITLYPKKNFITADGKVFIRNVLYRFKLTDKERDFYYKVSCYLMVKKDYEYIQKLLEAAKTGLNDILTNYFYTLPKALLYAQSEELIEALNRLNTKIKWYDDESWEEYAAYIPEFQRVVDKYIQASEQEFGQHIDIDTATFFAESITGSIKTGRALYGELHEFPSDLIPEF
jgi:hypothetical protein